MLMRVVVGMFLLSAVSCTSSYVTTKPMSKTQDEILQIWFNQDKQRLWVLKKAVTVEGETLTTYRKSEKGTEVVDVTHGRVKSQSDETDLWLCYRDSRRSRPQCYRARWTDRETGPVPVCGEACQRGLQRERREELLDRGKNGDTEREEPSSNFGDDVIRER